MYKLVTETALMLKKQTIKKSALVPTVLISGGAGFIGSHLVEALLNNKARVVVLDNFNTGKKIYVNQFLNNPNFALYDVDINEGIPKEIESVDYVFHLAGLEEYLFSKDLINLDSLLTNSLGTKNLLDLVAQSGGKFLLVSTIDVYQGKMSQLELDRYFGYTNLEDNKFSLTEAKRFAEAMAWEYFKKNSTDVRIVRLPEVYGPRMNLDASGNLGAFLKDIIEGRNITVYGDGYEKEHFLYVEDAVSGLLKALFNQDTKGGIYSLVPEEQISVLELAYLMKSLADGSIDVQFKPRIVEALSANVTPNTWSLKALNWKSKIDLREGVIKTLDWLGYVSNTNSFKPAKYITQKNHAAAISSIAASVSSVPSEISQAKISPPPQESSKRKFVWPKLPNFVFSKLAFFGFFRQKNIQIFANTSSGVQRSLLYTAYAFSVLFSAAVVFIAVPLFMTYKSSTAGVASLRNIENATLSLKTDDISKESAKATTNFTLARKYLHSLKWLFDVSKKQALFSTYDKSLSSLIYFSKSAQSISVAARPLKDLWDVIRPDSTATMDMQLVDNAQLEITNAQNYIRLAQADSQYIDAKLVPVKYKDEVTFYKTNLTKVATNLSLLNSLILELPQILGQDTEKNYLVWFQNSNELRPTGGFIGSYGILTFDKGKLKNLVIDDIYNPDGQLMLRGVNVPAPEAISHFIGEKQLYLRNSNWDPDFTKSVQTFGDLYFKATGEKMDGYIALDLSFVQNLLKVTGPVFLAAYNEEINADNLYERAQLHSDFNYQNGSDQKRSFLTVLGSKLLEKLFALKQSSTPQLFQAIEGSLGERHLMVYLSNNPLSLLLSEKKWDGSLVATKGDYLNVVNANVGGTKSNYFVKNKISYEVSSLTRDGLLRANLFLDYKHTGTSDAWPGGPYTDDVRVIVQNGSKLTGAKLIFDNNNETDIFKEVIVSREGNYTVFETAFKLETGKSARIIFSYDLPQNLSIAGVNKNYNLYWQKQAGTDGDEYQFVFNPPFGMHILSTSSNLLVDKDVVYTSGVLKEDAEYSLALY